MNVSRFSLRHRPIVWILLLVTTLAGLVSYLRMSRREDPEIKISVALVVTIWPGASAEKVERLITAKIEEKAQEIGDVEKVTSNTRDNISVIFVDAAFDADTAMVFQDLRNKIAEIPLPDGVIGPDVHDDFGDVTAMIWSLSSETATPDELGEWADRFEARLRPIESVGKVKRVGEQQPAIYIEGPLESFTLYGFSPLTAAKALDFQNVTAPAGYVRTGSDRLRMETTGAFEALERIRESVLDVSRETGHPLKVRHVFDVRRGWREPPIDLMLANGVPSLGIDVRMRRGHNIVEMGEVVRAAGAEFAKTLPPGIELTLLHDQPRHVDEFVGDFMQNLVEGLLIVIVVIFLAMGFRSAGIVALSLPLSIVITFAVMPLMGVDLELVSIGSFIVALGMLVDNAIIVTENIAVHLQRGATPEEAAEKGTQEIITPVVTGTLATVFAFLPLLVMQEEIGAYIRALPIVVSVSLFASLVLAVTVTPILATKFMRPRRERVAHGEGWFTRLYTRFMQRALRVRLLVVVLAFASLGGAVALMPVVGVSFFPEAFRDQFTIDVWLPESASLAETRRTVDEVIGILAEDEDVVSHAAYVGKGGPRFHITIKPVFNTSNYAQIMVNTVGPRATVPVIERLNEKFRSRIAGARVTAVAMYMGIPVEAPIAVRITGPDLDVMKDLSAQVQAAVRAVPGSDMVRDDLGEDVVSLRVDVDGEAAMMSGITNTEVSLALLTAYEGLPITRFRDGEDDVQVYLRLSEADRTLSNLEALQIPSMATGEKVPLAAFAKVTPQWQPALIAHNEGRRAITVLSNVHGRLADDVLRDALPGIEAVPVPTGYAVEVAGEHAERTKAFGDLGVVFGLILALILLMLVIQFNSLSRALVILFSVPLAIVGAVLGLFVSGNSFSFMAFLGVVSLAGMVIKNAVVWVEFVDRALESGSDLETAVVEAGRMRLRPILLTALTTIGGLLPLALFGGVLWEGMAWAMVFGLGVATVLTLVVIPCLYFMVLRRRYAGAGGGTGAGAAGAGAGGAGGAGTASGTGAASGPGAAAASGPGAATASGTAAALLLGLALSPGTAAAHPLEAYLTQAAQGARPVTSAAIDLEEARAQEAMAKASFLPQVGALATVTRLDQVQTVELDAASLGLPMEIPPMVLAEQNVYRVGGTVTLPLYAGGRRFAFLDASRKGLSARTHAAAAVEDGIRFGTAASYVQVLEADGLAAVLDEALAIERRFVEVVQAKAEVELAVPFDVSYAETRAADTERRLAMARSATRQRVQAFNDLVGAPLDAPVELRPVQFDPELRPELASLLETLEARPDLAARRDGAKAREAQVRATRGELLPNVALLGEGGYKDGDVGYVDGRGYWMVTAALSWTFDPVSLRRIDEARAQARRSAHEVDDARAQLALELHQAFQLHRDTEEILAVASRGVRTAAEGLANARAAYDAGVLEVGPVLDASRAFAEARQGYLRAYYARVLSELQLRYRAGLEVIQPVHLSGEDPFAQVGLPALAGARP